MPRAEKKPRDEMPYAVRFDVLARDNFTCVACGDRPGNGGLWVDHILPWSFGGSHDPLNLTTMCQRCNRGKGARIWLPPSMLLAPTDQEGFGVWKQFGSWNVEICESGMIANWPRAHGYLWFGIERCWEEDWARHFAGKCVHKGCDDACREFTEDDVQGPDLPPGHPARPKLVALTAAEWLLRDHRDDWDGGYHHERGYDHDMNDLRRVLSFMRAIYRRPSWARGQITVMD